MFDMFQICGLTIRVWNLITVQLLTVLSLVCDDWVVFVLHVLYGYE